MVKELIKGTIYTIKVEPGRWFHPPSAGGLGPNCNWITISSHYGFYEQWKTKAPIKDIVEWVECSDSLQDFKDGLGPLFDAERY